MEFSVYHDLVAFLIVAKCRIFLVPVGELEDWVSDWSLPVRVRRKRRSGPTLLQAKFVKFNRESMMCGLHSEDCNVHRDEGVRLAGYPSSRPTPVPAASL